MRNAVDAIWNHAVEQRYMYNKKNIYLLLLFCLLYGVADMTKPDKSLWNNW